LKKKFLNKYKAKKKKEKKKQQKKVQIKNLLKKEKKKKNNRKKKKRSKSNKSKLFNKPQKKNLNYLKYIIPRSLMIQRRKNNMKKLKIL